MPTTYSPGLQRLSELPGFTLVQGPCVVPGGLAVVGRLSCASTTEFDAIMTMAKAANFVCGFTPARLPLAIRSGYQRNYPALCIQCKSSTHTLIQAFASGYAKAAASSRVRIG